jgi:23S rRNA pseudouridine2605 synthase
MTETTTLLRAVIDATGLSRRKAFAAVREGRVAVDGSVARDPSAPYAGGPIALDGAAVAGATPRVYLLLNKPRGYVSTTDDERGRPTVLDLVPPRLRAAGLHPVGRLDLDTSGLLLLTNDGALTFHLTHPSNEVEKEYWVSLASDLSDAQLKSLREGVEIDGQLRKPAGVRRLAGREGFQLAVRLREGRKRQVRQLLESVGVRIVALRRVREGSLGLGDLAEGRLRALRPAEVAALLADERGSGGEGRRPQHYRPGQAKSRRR